MILVVCLSPALQKKIIFNQFIENRVNRAIQIETLASGKGLNCSRAIKKLNGNVLCLTTLGGVTGEFIEKELKKENISTCLFKVSAPTRSCFTLICNQTRKISEVIEPLSPLSSMLEKKILQWLKINIKKFQIIICIGSLPDGISNLFYKRVIQLAAKVKVPVILDAGGIAGSKAVIAKPFLFKPNRTELASLIVSKSRQSFLNKIKKLHQQGAQHILITDGNKKAFLSDGKRSFWIYPPKIKVNNPIGAGDSLAGGIGYALANRQSVIEALKFGIACGSASAEGDGYGMINRFRVCRLIKKVKIKEIKFKKD